MAKKDTTSKELTAEELAVKEQAAKEQAVKEAEIAKATEAETPAEIPTVEQYFDSNAKVAYLFFTTDGTAFYTHDSAQDFANKNLADKDVKRVENPKNTIE
jgi:GH18 family chitinase